jgi:hypothetical protein
MQRPFAARARAGCSTPVELACALAAEFGVVDPLGVDAGLDALAAQVGCVRGLDDAEQLAALAAVLATFEPVAAQADPGVLLLPTVLDRLEGAPAVLAVIACDVGRRVGMDLGVVGDGRRHLVAHRAGEEPLALDPHRRGAIAEGEAVHGLGWRCSHQVAFALLCELVECSLRAGDVERAIHAAELRLELPLSAQALETVRTELQTVRARLN